MEIRYKWGWKCLDEIEVVKSTAKTVTLKNGIRERTDSYYHPIFTTKAEAIAWRRAMLERGVESAKSRLSKVESELKELNEKYGG